MGLKIPRITQIRDQVDSIPTGFGPKETVYTQANNGAAYTESTYVPTRDGILTFIAVSTSTEQALTRWEIQEDTGGGFNPIVGCYSTSHSNAQFWAGGRANMSMPVRAGVSYTVVRVNLEGTQNTNDLTYFHPLEP